MNEKELQQVLEALRRARQYVLGAYECAFPDASENEEVLADVDNAIAMLSVVLR